MCVGSSGVVEQQRNSLIATGEIMAGMAQLAGGLIELHVATPIRSRIQMR
jgi:hypothetical protein